MKIIYDSAKPAHERVTIEGYFKEGEEMPIACFDIKVEFTNKGVPHSGIHFSRWGNIAERKDTHKAVWKKIQEAAEQANQPDSGE